MKRTLDQILEHFNVLEKEQREAAIQKLIKEQIRPHVLNVDNWRIDDMNRVTCTPIKIDTPNGCGERYQQYNMAWNRVAGEITSPGYSVSYSGSSWDIQPEIRLVPTSLGLKQKPRGRPKKTSTENTAEFIYKKTWERHGDDFLNVIQKETQRLVDFLHDLDNWNPQLRASKEFQWSERLRYTRYDGQAEVKRLALVQLETENLSLKFEDARIATIRAKIVGKSKKNPREQESDDDI